LIEAIIKPGLNLVHAQVLVREYRQRKRADFNHLLRAMAHQGFRRLLLTDMDSAPCVTSRKEKVKERHPDVEYQEIIVVSKEIESWYLAGITADGAVALRLSPPPYTDDLTKEDLERLRPPHFDSQLDFLLELLKHFDSRAPCIRNKSFAHFHSMLPS